MSIDIFDLNCPFCQKVYKLPREKVVKHVGKTIYCRGCGNPFSVPPLPVFESNPGVVLDSPKLVQVAATPKTVAARNDFDDVGESVEDRDEIDLAETNGHAASDNPSPIDLPPPFSADVLPPIEDVLPAMDEPPRVDLAADAESHPLSDVELPAYRASMEHGVVTVEEDASYFHDGDSSEGATAGDSLGVEPMLDSPGSAGASADDSDFADDSVGGAADSFVPEIHAFASSAQPEHVIPPKEPEPERKRVRPKRFVPSEVRLPADGPPSIPPGLNLDDVPIARAVTNSPPQTLSPTAPLNFRSLRSRLTFLAVMSVLIALLLAAILLAMLGYIPHRPV